MEPGGTCGARGRADGELAFPLRVPGAPPNRPCPCSVQSPGTLASACCVAVTRLP